MNRTKEEVKRANKDFYDIVGGAYEEIDGRRSPRLISYVNGQLGKIVKNGVGDVFLDLGCGSGFVSKIAKRYFDKCLALDISSTIIGSIEDSDIFKVAGDLESIPLKEGTVDCVVAFAALHHCYAFDKMLPEIYRVLRRGGVFYSDHDMDSFFFRKFRWPLGVYRVINSASRRYRSRFKEISSEMYDLSEYHKEGIPSHDIEMMLDRAGFSNISFEYHWEGLGSFTDKIFGNKMYNRGRAPLTRIFAVK